MTERVVALFDVDRTLVEGFSLFYFARFLQSEGIIGGDCLRNMEVGLEKHQSGTTYEVLL